MAQQTVTPAGPAQSPVPGADVLARLGHELRGPLNGIIGLVRIMLRKASAGTTDTGQQLRHLEMVQTSADQLLTTVERVAELAHLDLVPLDPGHDPVDLRPLVTAVVDGFQADARARGVHLDADLDALDAAAPVSGGSDDIRRLLAELVDNAVKYTDSTRVGVRAATGSAGTVVDVRDDGPGISARDRPRIFGPFVRGDAAADRTVPGSGLGLCLAGRLAARCGAELSLTDTPSGGSTFRVRWPESRAG